MALALVLLATLAAAQGTSDTTRCSWSAVWREIAPQGSRSNPPTLPRHRKGSLERLRPNPGERYHLEGPWIVSMVIDARGDVVDARMLRTASDPPWPRYEAHLLKSVRKLKYEPARVDGKPEASCVTLQVIDK